MKAEELLKLTEKERKKVLRKSKIKHTFKDLFYVMMLGFALAFGYNLAVIVARIVWNWIF